MDPMFSILSSLAITAGVLFGISPEAQTLDQTSPQVLPATTVTSGPFTFSTNYSPRKTRCQVLVDYKQ